MDYVRQYKSFINSHYLNGAIRITIGITLPAILLSHFNNLTAGIALSIGAMCVGNTDIPGPIELRRNGMIACILIIFLVALSMGLASESAIAKGILVFIFCFIFSFIGIYGARASSIGANALLIMVLSLARPHHGIASLINALYALAGGLWYMLLSLMLYSFRPYKLVQQALGDALQSTAGYLRIKASFYARDVDYEKAYRQLLESQVGNHEKQELVRELLFRSRNVLRESTHIGRVLLMIYLDIIDLFERIMTSQQDYRELHSYFDEAGLMEECRQLILDIADDLEGIAIALMSGKPSFENAELRVRVLKVRADLQGYQDKVKISAAQVSGAAGPTVPAAAFAGMSDILDSIDDLADRLHTLHGYTTYDRKLAKDFKPEIDVDEFVVRNEVDRKLIVENLNLRSNIFRHSLRVSIATIAGFIVSRFLPLGHGYWILLTIVVILKPAYSLTKRRNIQRLIGTIAGGIVGVLLLYFITNPTALYVLMILFMIGTYVFIRTDYLVAVILMTPYVLLVFHLLYPHDFHSVIYDRIFDTGIGSAISFLASILIIPTWEHERITDFMTAALEANLAYFRDVAGGFVGMPPTTQRYTLSRKNAFVALANLSDALARMLSEPRSRQRGATEMHQFVVSNHMLTSHIATLAYYYALSPDGYKDVGYRPVVEEITARLRATDEFLKGLTPAPAPVATKEAMKALNEMLKATPEYRKIADQFNFLTKVTSDIYKISLAFPGSSGPARSL
jgi:uncharacterized membrane protein (TIGR01666 family)